MGAQQGRAVRRPGGGAVQRRDDVPPRGPPFELHRYVLRHFLRSDALHLAEPRDGLELVRGEEAVLADVDVHPLEWLPQIAPRLRARPEGIHHRHGLGAIDQRDRPPFAPNRSEANLAPRDRRGGLDLDRRRGTGRTAQQEQQQRLGARHRRLGQERPTGALLRVGVGDVEPHAAGAARADLHIRLGFGASQRLDEDLHVPDQLGHGEKQDVTLHRRAVDLAVGREREQVLGALERVLIGERRRGVDAVHDGVRLVFQQQLVQEAAVEDVVGEFAQQVLEHQPAVRGARHDRAALQLSEARREEHVSPLDLDRGAAAVRLERPRGRAHLVFEQRHQHHAARRGGEQPPRHGVTHQPAPPEDHRRPVTQFHAVARWLGSRRPRVAGTSLQPAAPDAPARRRPGATTRP